MSECGAIWLPGAEVTCMLEAGHGGGEHSSKIVIHYDNGDVGVGQLTWNQESQRGDNESR